MQAKRGAHRFGSAPCARAVVPLNGNDNPVYTSATIRAAIAVDTHPNIHIHQIFYNEATRAQVDPGFIPLDNTANPRPDWYEFWVMLDFLRNNALEPGHWYGFVSPNFHVKTTFRSPFVKSVIAGLPDRVDALVVPTFFDQTALFLNQFEQGETLHKGLIPASEAFLRPLGYNLARLVSHSSNSTYSNFVIGRPSYWQQWKELAEKFFAYCEAPGSPLGTQLTTYRDGDAETSPMKVFIQERLASVILAFGGLVSAGIDLGDKAVIVDYEWRSKPRLRRLQAMDHLKQAYCLTPDPIFLQAFARLRDGIGSLPKPPQQTAT